MEFCFSVVSLRDVYPVWGTIIPSLSSGVHTSSLCLRLKLYCFELGAVVMFLLYSTILIPSGVTERSITSLDVGKYTTAPASAFPVSVIYENRWYVMVMSSTSTGWEE